jgi:uncharacterized membrane protein YebE (DUF533 family)
MSALVTRSPQDGPAGVPWSMLEKLSGAERLRLMRFICSFAWVDLDVHAKERAFVSRMMSRLALDEEEARQVKGWLEVPPRSEEVDPQEVPARHRRIFLDAIRATIEADGVIVPEEQEAYSILEELLS